jgi:hypothetical protein
MGDGGMREEEDRFGQRATRPRLPRKWAIIALIPVLAIYIYSKKQTYDNPNPLKRIETSEDFVWPAGCTEAAYKASFGAKDYNTQIPCACADPKYEIKDWYERGLSKWGVPRNRLSYHRIGDDAVAIKRSKWDKNICSNESGDAVKWEKFFVRISGDKK